MAPFSGVIFKSPGKPNQVVLEAKGGSFRNIKIIIDNVAPNHTFSETQSTHVSTKLLIVGVFPLLKI